MPALRGHHLICLHFFLGDGYNQVFVRTLKEVLNKAEEEEVIITDGADDVCKACPYLMESRCEKEANADEKVKTMDETALMLLNIKKDIIQWGELKRMIPEIFSTWYANYCYDCEWLKTCEKHPDFQKLKAQKVLR
ncbi:MAG: DUF1284 domain-containing protein [Thermodesulfobacteriaceae bacterium]|nr:DUF1284 domain-containing protein [Thermodesulfobacteriaceae bacterium]